MPPSRRSPAPPVGRRLRRAFGMAAAGLLLALPPAPALGQQLREVRVQADNDNFTLWTPRERRPDFEYTHGTRISAVSRSAPVWGSRLAPDVPVCDEGVATRCAQTVWEIGQLIFTPRSNAAEPIEGDRPYAGWLFGAATAQLLDPVRRHGARLEIGVSGDPSLAGPLQRFVHRLGGFWEPLGWENQIPFEVGGRVGYEYAHVALEGHLDGVRVLEVTPSVRASLGTLRTSAEAGLDARLGFRVPHSWWDPIGGRDPGNALFLVGGVRGEAVARDLFLDGSTWSGSPSVERRPLVMRHRVGAVLRLGRVDGEVSTTTRTPEYRTEPGGHRFTTFAVTVRP